jgi:large subunit ribosomal protein L25
MAMKTSISISATSRTGTGKGVARQLRARGRVPAVVYGRGRDPQALSVGLTEFEKAMAGHSHSSILALDVDGSQLNAVVREVQRHPFLPGIVHIDFYEIHEGVALTVSVPIHLHGIPAGVRSQGGILDQSLREVSIEVLPRDIPEAIDVNVDDLMIGQSIHLAEITLENVRFLADPKTTICSVVAPRVEAVEVEAEEGAEEPEAKEGEEPELIRRPKDADAESRDEG